MPKRWIGLVISGAKVTIVDAEIPDSGPIVIQADDSWPLQQGDRAPAYCVMHQHIADYVRENKIDRVLHCDQKHKKILVFKNYFLGGYRDDQRIIPYRAFRRV